MELAQIRVSHLRRIFLQNRGVPINGETLYQGWFYDAPILGHATRTPQEIDSSALRETLLDEAFHKGVG